MGRPSKLTDAQWSRLEKRLLAGETATSLGKEFGISEAAIRKRYDSHKKDSAKVRGVAQTIAIAQTALESLAPAQRPAALDMADKLRSISVSYAAAADLGAKTGHRLHALANAEVNRVDDANPLSDESLAAMKGVSLLTKLGNDALVPASNLLAASKERMMPTADGDGPASGVLVVPGVLKDAKAWTHLVQGK